MNNTQIKEYDPLSFLEELEDEFILDMIKTGDIHEFCYSLTLDLNMEDTKIDC